MYKGTLVELYNRILAKKNSNLKVCSRFSQYIKYKIFGKSLNFKNYLDKMK